MNVEECFQLGYFVKPHGINGELNLFIDSDFPERYIYLESVFVEVKQKLIPFFISKIQFRGKKAIVKLDDINEIDQAESLKNAKVFLPLSFLPDLDDDQFYYHEILGFLVIDKMFGEVGEVSNVFSANGNDLLAVNHKGKEVLIPLQDHIILKVDKTDKKISVDLPIGLLDVYINP